MWPVVLAALPAAPVARARRFFGSRRAAVDPAPPPPKPRYEALPELARLYERTLDKQLDLLQMAEARADRAVTLAVGALGGGLGLVTLVGAGTLTALPVTLVGLLAIGALLNLAALALLVGASLADATGVVVGPPPGWLVRHAKDPAWRLLDHRASLVAVATRDVERNRDTLKTMQDRRRQGLQVLSVAAAAYAAAFLHISLLALET